MANSHDHHRLHLTPLLSLFLAAAAMTAGAAPSAAAAHSSSCPVYPTAPLIAFLERVQETALAALGPKGFDPKFYVDLSLRFSLPVVQKAFLGLPRSNDNGTVPPAAFNAFVHDYFGGPEEDLVVADLPDYVPEPEGFLPKVKHPRVRAWALEVHSLWKNLSREVSASVRDRPDLHTLLPLPERFVIPGSRFREVYYWDSYWVIRGLLASKMFSTAKGMVRNLMYLLDNYGHVLNGARAYYTNRSQPPLLSAMVREIYSSTRDVDFVKEALPVLLKEHEFWTSGVHQIVVRDAHGETHSLSRYYAMWDKPRPESLTIDIHSASNISNPSQKKHFFRELASTAESGWDFSTRWMRNPEDITTLSTTSILPVDLNVFILGMELDISFFAKIAGDDSTAEHFTDASKVREEAIKSIFWNEKKGQWFDYWLTGHSSCKEGQVFESGEQNHAVFASNFIPLWIRPFSSVEKLVEKVLDSFRSSELLYDAGIATSLTKSGQQWDFPNGWAPILHMIVEGLMSSGSSEAKSLAEDIAIRWIRTNYAAYKKMGVMHEKYDVEECGEYGGGGEYVPQTGFGWSNGVVLAFLEEFGWPQDREIDCQ